MAERKPIASSSPTQQMGPKQTVPPTNGSSNGGSSSSSNNTPATAANATAAPATPTTPATANAATATTATPATTANNATQTNGGPPANVPKIESIKHLKDDAPEAAKGVGNSQRSPFLPRGQRMVAKMAEDDEARQLRNWIHTQECVLVCEAQMKERKRCEAQQAEEDQRLYNKMVTTLRNAEEADRRREEQRRLANYKLLTEGNQALILEKQAREREEQRLRQQEKDDLEREINRFKQIEAEALREKRRVMQRRQEEISRMYTEQLKKEQREERPTDSKRTW